jgi:hypothetical protein
MAFVGSTGPNGSVSIASGGGNVTVPVPQLVDVSNNGFSGNLFSHYQYNGVAFAINPANNTVTVAQGASATPLYFGNVQR